MKKPLSIVYGMDEMPPRGVLLLSGVQHVGLVAIFLLVPVIACRAAGLPPEKILDVLSLSMHFRDRPVVHAGAGARRLPAVFRPVAAGRARVYQQFHRAGHAGGVAAQSVFRLGVRRTQTLEVDSVAVDARQVEAFMYTQGGAWGARRDVIERARFNLMQSIELLVDSGVPRGLLTVVASFDEFSLDVRVTYDGVPLALPKRRPTNDEIISSQAGQYRLAGYLLRQLADRVQISNRQGRTTAAFHFDH